MKLIPNDLHFVVSRMPKDIRSLLEKYPGKLFVAGGFIRSIIAGEEPSDIDMFGETEDMLGSLAKQLSTEREGRWFSTDNAFTVLSPPRIPVQFITRWLFNDPEKVVQSFDFTVCQACVWYGHDNKYHSQISDNFYIDLAARRLVYTNPVREEEAGGSFMRVLKFIKRGYNIQPGSLGQVLARIYRKIDWESVSRRDKIDSEITVGHIITGLLRQVDPLRVIDGIDFVDEHENIKVEGV